jgi:16S rRNA processing protein RimM
VGLLRIGKVVRALGLGGHLGIAGPEGAIAELRKLALRRLGGETEVRAVQEAKRQGKLWAVRFDGISDRSAAEGWIGADVFAEREDMGEAGQGLYWWGDLEGLAVETAAGQTLGRVTGLYVTGGIDVLVVKGQKGERLVPLAPYVRVERESARVVVDPPEGLLELGEEEEKGDRSQRDETWRGSRSRS